MSATVSSPEKLRIADASIYDREGRTVLHLDLRRPNREQYKIASLLRGSGAAAPIKRARCDLAALLTELSIEPQPSFAALVKVLRGKFVMGRVAGIGTAYPRLVLASAAPPAAPVGGGTWV